MDYQNENYINNLVDRYKKTKLDKLRNEVINNFKPYFKKYARIFCSRGVIDFTNKDTITFFRLFMSKEERLSTERCVRAAEKYLVVLRRIFRDFTKQDMCDEILIYFLEALEKYKPMIADHKRSRERISFTHYILVNLRYKVYKLCSIKSRDALSSGDNIPYIPHLQSELSDRRSRKIRVEPQDINLDWVYKKDVAGDIFDYLTEIERYLLWLKYESHPRGKKLTNKQIAKRIGLHYKTVEGRIDKIREKLKEIIIQY